jgi:hypothetical protein
MQVDSHDDPGHVSAMHRTHLVCSPSARLLQILAPKFEIRLNIFITRLSLPGMTFAEYRIMSVWSIFSLVLASMDARFSCARSSPCTESSWAVQRAAGLCREQLGCAESSWAVQRALSMQSRALSMCMQMACAGGRER